MKNDASVPTFLLLIKIIGASASFFHFSNFSFKFFAKWRICAENLNFPFFLGQLLTNCQPIGRQFVTNQLRKKGKLRLLAQKFY